MTTRLQALGYSSVLLNTIRGLVIVATVSALIAWLSGIRPALLGVVAGVVCSIPLEIAAARRRRKRT